jgi:hypothetical protein
MYDSEGAFIYHSQERESISDLVMMEALLIWRGELSPKDEEEILPRHGLMRTSWGWAVWAGNVLPLLLLDIETVQVSIHISLHRQEIQ